MFRPVSIIAASPQAISTLIFRGPGVSWVLALSYVAGFQRPGKGSKIYSTEGEKEYFNEQICANKNNTGAIWKTIRRALPKKSSCTTHYTKDPSILVKNSTSFFISVGVNAAGKSPQLARSLRLTDYLPSCSNNSPKSGEGLFDLKRVSCSEVREVLTAMPFNKAPRYDRIPLFVIKDCLPLHTSDFN